jgi:hypothetical protein
MKRDVPKELTAVHGSLGITYHPDGKANVIADSLESSSHLMTSVTKTMSDRWRLQSELCLHL